MAQVNAPTLVMAALCIVSLMAIASIALGKMLRAMTREHDNAMAQREIEASEAHAADCDQRAARWDRLGFAEFAEDHRRIAGEWRERAEQLRRRNV